jgi:type I restriction enzyme S subunit
MDSMSEWKEIKLNEVIEFVVDNRGKNPPYELSGYEVIETGCISGKSKYPDYKLVKKYVNESTYSNWFRKGHPIKNDLLIITVGNGIGSVAIMQENRGVITQNLIALRFNKSNANANFYYYYLNQNSIQEFLQSLNIGSAQPSLKVPHLLNLEVPNPPIKFQNDVANILSSLDEKISLLHRQNATLEEMAETLFRQWFVEESKEEREEGVLSDLINVKYGKDHKNLADGNIPAFGSGGLMRKVERALYEFESVLIPRKGTLNNVMYINEPFWTVDTMFYTEMKQSGIAKFIYHFLKTQDLASMNVGSAVPSMTTEVLNNMTLSIPPINVFESFEEVVNPLYKKMSINKTQIQTLTTLRDTLLPKLMSGEVSVV